MKTVIIFDNLFENPIRFFVVDGDFSHLNGVYSNSRESTEEQVDELCKLVFDEEWHYKPFLEDFPVDEVKNGAKVIVCRFLP